MRLNKKGISLVELLLSIVLISIVIAFIFNLLIDLRNETSNNNYAYDNQINRIEAIYTIQKDLNTYKLLGVEDSSNDNNIELKFYYDMGYVTDIAFLRTEVIDNKYYLSYSSASKEKYRWEMKDAVVDSCADFDYYINNTSKNYYFKINIYLYNQNYNEDNSKERNNAVDDIEITYSGNKEDLNTTNSLFLTRDQEVMKKIGVCTN